MTTLSVTVAALVLSPSAHAALSAEPAALARSTVEQTVGTVSDVTRQVTTAVGSAAPAAQPVTTAVQETTTELTRNVTTPVEESTPAPAAVVEKTTRSVHAVRSAAPSEAPAASPQAAHPPTSPAPRPSGDPQPAAQRDHATPAAPRQAARQSAGRQPAEVRSGPAAHDGELVAPAQPPLAKPVSAGKRPQAGEGRPEAGSSAPAGDVPALAGGSASAPSTGFGLAGLALLAIAFCLTAPRVVRDLLSLPADMRPALIVSALERPG